MAVVISFTLVASARAPASARARALAGVGEHAVPSLRVKDADSGPDEVGRRLHQIRVGAVAAQDERDVVGQVVMLEVSADRRAGVVADGRDSPPRAARLPDQLGCSRRRPGGANSLDLQAREHALDQGRSVGAKLAGAPEYVERSSGRS